MKRSFLFPCAVFIRAILSGTVWGADYPSKAITLICPYAAGVSIDTLSRGLAPYLGQV